MSWREAPSTFHSRAGRHGPRALAGSRASRCPGRARSPRRRSSSMTACRRAAISFERRLPRDPLERPSPLRPVRRSGYSRRSGASPVLEIAVDLRAQRAAVNGCSRLPRSRTASPSSTVTTQLQPSGQSSGQAPSTSPSWRNQAHRISRRPLDRSLPRLAPCSPAPTSSPAASPGVARPAAQVVPASPARRPALLSRGGGRRRRRRAALDAAPGRRDARVLRGRRALGRGAAGPPGDVAARTAAGGSRVVRRRGPRRALACLRLEELVGESSCAPAAWRRSARYRVVNMQIACAAGNSISSRCGESSGQRRSRGRAPPAQGAGRVGGAVVERVPAGPNVRARSDANGPGARRAHP